MTLFDSPSVKQPYMSAASFLHNSQRIYFVKLDIYGKYSYVNTYFATQFAYLQIDLLGASGTVAVHPRDYDIFHAALDKCFEDAGSSNLVLRMKKEGGGCFLTEWEFSPSFDANGKPEGVCCIGFNTNEASLNQLRLEIKLQSLKMISDSSSDAILLLDKNYKILAHNRPAENLSVELYSQQYLPGDDFRKYIRPGAEHQFYRQFHGALLGTVSDEVFEMVKPNGSIVALKVQMTPVYDDSDSAVSGVAMITKDVTVILDLSNRLNNISVMQSHQIRRPVANMMSLVALIEGAKLNDDEKEYLQLLKTSINQLEEEIRQIVHTARKG